MMRELVLTTLMCALTLVAGVTPAYAGGGMNCGFGSWEGDDETVRLYPTYAYVDTAKSAIVVPVHVWVFEREEDRLRRAAVELMAKQLELEEGSPERAVFRRRMVDFMVDNESGKEITVRIGVPGAGTVEKSIGETPSNGHLFGTVEFPLAKISKKPKKRAKSLPDAVVLTVRVDEEKYSAQTISVPVVPATGLTVISDIDDTIKVTGVLDKKELLANSLYREFRPVPGMSEYFDAWAEKGAAVHYLSASPWNLHADLEDFRKKHGFPSGVYHLRILRLKDMRETAAFIESSESHKVSELTTLLEAFPKRRFVLVGDSGERDPEIYGKLARKYSDRVEKIVIREVPGAKNEDERFEAAFEGVDDKVWSTVKH